MSKTETLSGEAIFPYSKRLGQMASLQKQYREAQPYPHIVLENFLQPETLEKALSEFPDVQSGGWIHYVHFNEKKFGKNKLDALPPTPQAIIQELNSKPFLEFLTALTGIPNLYSDQSLEGGGLHQSKRGGFLNIHADFTVHPHHRQWQRRTNVIVYLNKNWLEDYGGHLELWDRTMTRMEKKVSPIFNRCVIFNTDADSFHGHPHPLQCPEDVTRKSIALYYYTQEAAPQARSTEYRARPEDHLKAILIYADKMALRFYDFAKRRLGLSDNLTSKILSLLSGTTKKGK
jgi:Rps23 Pro-64 3,4-dihydroxylase Tpa1-like proline 4-hydroxylase